MAQSAFVTNKITGLPANNEYERESSLGGQIDPFSTWLRERCARMVDNDSTDVNELTALSIQPSRRVCSFRSMMSYGSHYRIEGDGAGEQHVTYDCGVAELQALREGDNCADPIGVVHIIRVGTLKDIMVLNYVNLNVVLMVVSWVAKHTEMQPRLRRDAHRFRLANLDAMPRCNNNPYILPSLASQMRNLPCYFLHPSYVFRRGSTPCTPLQLGM